MHDYKATRIFQLIICKMILVLFFFFLPMPPHVLMNFRGFPAGCGNSVANF